MEVERKMSVHEEDTVHIKESSGHDGPPELVQYNNITLRHRSWFNQSLTSQSSSVETQCRTSSDYPNNIMGSGSDVQGQENLGYEEQVPEGNEKVKENAVEEGAEVSYPQIHRQDEPSTKSKCNVGFDGSAGSEGFTLSCSCSSFKGMVLALLSTACTSICALNTALLAGAISSNEIVFMQMLFYFLLSVPLGIYHRVSPVMSRNALLLVLYRCISGSTAMLLGYFAYQVIPLGNAKAIIYSSPVFTIVLSCLILHDPCDVIDFALSFITFGGVILVIQPPFIFGIGNSSWTSSSFLGSIFCVICSIIVGTNFVALRKLSVYRVPATAIIFYFAIIGMIISCLVTTIFQEWVIPGCGRERQLLIMNGIFAFLAQLFLNLALHYETPTTVALIRTSDVLFTFTFDYIFFGTIPNAITVTGSTVIVGCLVTITLKKWWAGKKQLEKHENKASESVHEDVP